VILQLFKHPQRDTTVVYHPTWVTREPKRRYSSPLQFFRKTKNVSYYIRNRKKACTFFHTERTNQILNDVWQVASTQEANFKWITRWAFPSSPHISLLH